MPLQESNPAEGIIKDSDFTALYWKCLSKCYEIPSQIRDRIMNNSSPQRNGIMVSLVLLETGKVISVEMNVLQAHVNATCIIMHNFLFALLSSRSLLSENKFKGCSPWLNKTYSYGNRWERKGRKNSFQVDMSTIPFSLKEREKKVTFGTQSGALAGR